MQCFKGTAILKRPKKAGDVNPCEGCRKSNNSRGRLLFFSPQKGAIIRGWRLIE